MKKISWLVLFVLIFVLSWYVFPRQEKISGVVIGGQIFSVEVAADKNSRTKGLSGRDSLAADSGMLFVFADKSIRSFWMKDMEFALDLLWLDGNKIIGYEQNIQPAADANELVVYTSPLPVDRVLEVSAGTIERLEVEPGDQIIYHY